MQKKRNRGGTVLGILLPMGLTCLFAFCSLALAFLGGGAYKRIQAANESSFDSTVAVSYLRTKLSQAGTNQVLLRQEEDIQVLVIQSENESGTLYETRIFMAQDGRLMETFELASSPFTPLGDMVIAQLSSCYFSLSEDGLFVAELTSHDGEAARTCYALPQGGVL